MITIVAIGAPITEAESAAIPARIREDPNIPIPIEFQYMLKYLLLMLRELRLEKIRHQKKPMLRHTTVTD